MSCSASFFSGHSTGMSSQGRFNFPYRSTSLPNGFLGIPNGAGREASLNAGSPQTQPFQGLEPNG
eukprot:4862483-Heterocapsa_arctica.AAC.1